MYKRLFLSVISTQVRMCGGLLHDDTLFQDVTVFYDINTLLLSTQTYLLNRNYESV